MTTARCETRSGCWPPLLRAVDCVTVPVPDLDTGLAFYRGALGHGLLRRNDDLGQAALAVPDAETELDPFGNVLVLLAQSRGRYVTDASGDVTGTTAPPSTPEGPGGPAADM